MCESMIFCLRESFVSKKLDWSRTSYIISASQPLLTPPSKIRPMDRHHDRDLYFLHSMHKSENLGQVYLCPKGYEIQQRIYVAMESKEVGNAWVSKRLLVGRTCSYFILNQEVLILVFVRRLRSGRLYYKVS